MNSTTRHDELLADFRSKVEHAKTLRKQSAMLHRANLSSQISRMSEEASRKEKRQSVHAAHMDQVRSHVEAEVVTGIDTVEANLRRLGLDNASAHRVPRASSKAQQAKELHVRPSIIHGSSMGGGVVAFLRRTGEKSGVDSTCLFMTKEQSPVRGKQKLTGPKALYPTMRTHLHESDEEAPSDVRDVSYEALNDEYVNKIRGRKDDDVQALREREVRRHRMNGEQSRSKNQVLEQKELEKLLLRAKLINAPDRQRVIDKRIEGIQKDLEKKLRAEMIGRRRDAASATVEAQLQHHLNETVEQRSAELAEFAVLRNQGKQREDHIKHEKLRDKEAFCRLLVNGVVGMVGEVIERSTSTLQDGTEQYNRATIGITEWREMVARHLSHKDAPSSTAAEPENTATSAVHSVVEVPLQEVQSREVDVSQMVQADIDFFTNHTQSLSQAVLSEPTSFRAVFVGGDSIISGIDLLTQNGDATFTAGERREYLLITPQVLQHLEYQSAKRTLDESLRDVEEALVQVTTDLQAKQAMLAAQTPIVKGKRDAKTKDTSPLAQSVMQLSSVHSELTQQQSSIRLDASKLHTNALVHTASDAELGALVGSLISCRQAVNGHSVQTEYGNQVPLSMIHIQYNPDLADAVLLFAGFPLTKEFGSAVQEHVTDLSTIAYCDLGCDAVSAVHRLDGVQEFLKYPRPPAAPIEMEASQGKKKSVKIAPPTPAPAFPTEDPKAVLAHPLLSPLVVYRGERDVLSVLSPQTAPTHPGRASPSMIRSNSVSTIVPTTCPDVNDLEYATSPFMLPQDGDRSTARSKFTKFVKWYSGREPNQFQWLLDYSHNQLPAEAASRMKGASIALGGIHCFKAVAGDSVLGEGPVVTNATPGTAARVPDVDDTVYFSQFVISTKKLCKSIILSQSEATNTAVAADAVPLDTSVLKDAATSYRTSLADGLQAVQRCLGEAAKYMSNTTRCFPVATFSVAPSGENINTEEGLALARWKQCDQQRKIDSNVIGSLLTELDTVIGNALETITWAQSQLDIPMIDQGVSDSYWAHGADMLRSLQEQCRHALHEWCLHLFTLHCEVIEATDGYFAASSEFRPHSPAELLSIISVSGALIHSLRCLDFKPDITTTRPTPAQMGVVLWACSIEGRVGDYITPSQYDRCASLLALVAAAAPSLVPSDSIRLFQGRLFGGTVPIGWILMTAAMGATAPMPTAFQAIKFAAALHASSHSEFMLLPWWGVDAGVIVNLLELRNQMEPGMFEPFILAFLASDTKSQNKPNLLRRWFAVIGSFESGVPSEVGSLSKESLCTKFPRGSWDRVDLDLLQYLIGDVSGFITIEALSSTPLGELLVGRAAMSFV